MKTPEQWDEEGVAYASVAKKIQDDALNSVLEEAAKAVMDELRSWGYPPPSDVIRDCILALKRKD